MLSSAVLDAAPGVTLHITGGDAGIRSILFRPEGTTSSADGHPVVEEAVRQLRAYFAGDLARFNLPLDPQGTPFQLQVWRTLCEIPYGETRSYGWVADAIGSPSAVRAVGAANGANPISIVVPCHRVIGASGKLTGYGGGLPVKQQLLELEAKYAWRNRPAPAG
jgi:methylated-DNA-[protein]-cysteine S-methyltransferase